MKQFVIDGAKEVALKYPTANELEAGEEKVDKYTSEHANVYAVDIAMSTGEGKPRPFEVLCTTVFKWWLGMAWLAILWSAMACNGMTCLAVAGFGPWRGVAYLGAP